MGNCKLFVLMGAGAVGVYLAAHHLVSHKSIKYTGPPPAPTIQFVAPGTPGAKTFSEWQEEQRQRQVRQRQQRR